MPKPPGQTPRTRSTPQTYLSIVSPCSTCQNQREVPEAGVNGMPGKPACPRRAWMKTKKDREAAGLTSKFNMDHLVLTGTGGEALRNPVYDDKGGSILVWVAHLKDNPGILDSNGNVVAPQIMDESFLSQHTDYINCHSVPLVPQDSEAQYRMKGVYKEGDQVESTIARDHQRHVDAAPDGNTHLVAIDGFVTKVNFYSQFVRAKIGKDEAPAGT